MAVILSTSGNDTESGTTGDDIVYGTAGQDVFDGDAGYDVVDLSTLTSGVTNTGDNGSFLIFYHLGGSTALTNFEEIIGTNFDDRLTLSTFTSDYADDLVIDGGMGNDMIRGSFGHDTLIGGDGDDFLFDGIGVDTIVGGSGNDTLRLLFERYGNFEDELATAQSVVIDLRDQTISNDGFGNVETMSGIENLSAGSVYGDTYDGNANNNELVGASFNNTIRARAGDDHVFVFGGGDMDGGLGFDKLTLQAWQTKVTDGADADLLWDDAFATDTVEIDLSTGVIINDGYGSSGTATNFEELEVFTVDLDAIINGSSDDDIISFTGDGAVITAGSGNDIVNGSVGIDTLSGEAGNDQLFGMDGDDILAGGANNDTLWGGSGLDTLNGNNGDDYLNGGADKDKLFGNGGDDELRGGAGDDTLSGNAGADELYGGGGKDILLIDDDDTVIDGGFGYDRVIVTNASSNIVFDLAATNIEQVWGNATAETFDASGMSSFAKIFGGGGADTIIGGAAGDRIYGEAGDDIMTGNGGNDRFFFDTGWGQDTVSDFTLGNDRLDVTAAGISQLSDMTITDDSGDTLITFGADSIRLTGVDHLIISDANFVYAPMFDAPSDAASSDELRNGFYDSLFEIAPAAGTTAEQIAQNESLMTDLLLEAEGPVIANDAPNSFASHIDAFGLGPSSFDNGSLFSENDLGLWDMF